MKKISEVINKDTIYWSIPAILLGVYWLFHQVFGDVPNVNSISITKTFALKLPFGISRWWDVIFLLIGAFIARPEVYDYVKDGDPKGRVSWSLCWNVIIIFAIIFAIGFIMALFYPGQQIVVAIILTLYSAVIIYFSLEDKEGADRNKSIFKIASDNAIFMGFPICIAGLVVRGVVFALSIYLLIIIFSAVVSSVINGFVKKS